MESYSYEHPLIFLNQLDGDRSCMVCTNIIHGPCYGCKDCGVVVEKSCLNQLPQECKHLFHPSHHLQLTHGEFNCNACLEEDKRISFRCKECEFDLCLNCILLKPYINYDLHQHPLCSFEEKIGSLRCTYLRCVECDLNYANQLYGEKIFNEHHGNQEEDSFILLADINGVKNCKACTQIIQDPCYSCNICRIFIHKSCFDKLPRQIKYPFHSHKLELEHVGDYICQACCLAGKSLAFRCPRCSIHLHLDCTTMKPLFKIKGHHHPLIPVEKDYDLHKFTCLQCWECDKDFCIHETRFPLTLNYKCYYNDDHHPLFLISRHLEDGDEYYCDICEQERNPYMPIYYCKECKFFADIKCIMAKVRSAPSKNTGHGHLISIKELKKMEAKEAKKKQPPHLADADLKITYDESLKIKPFLKLLDAIGDNQHLRHLDFKKMKVTKFPLYSDKPINMFMDIFYRHLRLTELPEYYLSKIESDAQNSENQDVLKSEDDSESDIQVDVKSESDIQNYRFILRSHLKDLLDCPKGIGKKYVKVGDYMVRRNYAEDLDKLFVKYGDFSADSFLSPKLKVPFFDIFCKTIDMMSKMRVKNASMNLFLKWASCFKIMKLAGFKVDFASNHLERVVHAYFGFEAENLEKSIICDSTKEIQKLEGEMQRLEEKMKSKSNLINELNAKREMGILLANAEKSLLMQKCINERYAIGWKEVVGDILLKED